MLNVPYLQDVVVDELKFRQQIKFKWLASFVEEPECRDPKLTVVTFGQSFVSSLSIPSLTVISL